VTEPHSSDFFMIGILEQVQSQSLSALLAIEANERIWVVLNDFETGDLIDALTICENILEYRRGYWWMLCVC
jgi:hypothetical protein